MSKSRGLPIIFNNDKTAEQKEDKMNKKVRRKRHSAYRRKANMTSKILSEVIVIGISVLAGYMTANYVLGPMLGLESEPAFLTALITSLSLPTPDGSIRIRSGAYSSTTLFSA